jgi:17beta-estradiol 17-dehydrogenase / very-long-chain 3-oxoacyl-CoA reductase
MLFVNYILFYVKIEPSKFTELRFVCESGVSLFSMLDLALKFLGLLVLAKYSFGFLHGIYARLIRGGKNLKKKFGSWGKKITIIIYNVNQQQNLLFIFVAVITGATDGIGEAMAFEFAKKGLNIVLISRTKDKLEQTKSEILKKFPAIKVDILQIDFSNFDTAAQTSVVNLLNGLDIGVLVNNVGVSYPYPKFFHELENKRVEELISINVNSTTWMTRIVLPSMIERKRGSIVNIASGSFIFLSYCVLLLHYFSVFSTPSIYLLYKITY